MGQFIRPLAKHLKEWSDLTARIGMQATENPDAVGGAASAPDGAAQREAGTARR